MMDCAQRQAATTAHPLLACPVQTALRTSSVHRGKGTLRVERHK